MAIELYSGRGDYSFWLRYAGGNRVRECDVDTRHWTENLSTTTGIAYACKLVYAVHAGGAVLMRPQ
eukprot:4972370-Pyramimonas_sp.AAC.1